MEQTVVAQSVDISTDVIINKSTNETFISYCYNQVKLIKRSSDNYFNGTKIGRDNGKETRQYINSKTFRLIVEEWKKRYPGVKPYYKLEKGVIKELSGFYVHPRLVHFICYWADIQYAFKVADIMDAIDEKNKLTNQTLDDTINDLQNEVDELKKQLAEKSSVIEAQDKLIDIQGEVIKKQNIDIFQNHSRTTKYNVNHL